MLRPLLERGRRLESEGRLLAPGFYDYSAPIRWVVHVWPGPPVQTQLAAAEIALPRPDDGRTSAIRAHPLVDEAGYALGVDRVKGGDRDEKAARKHETFVTLLTKAENSPEIRDPLLRRAIASILEVLRDNLVAEQPRYAEIRSKDWVSFVFEEGALAGQQLFEHPEVKAFWMREVGERTTVLAGDGQPKRGQCAICGANKVLAGKIPLGVKLFKPIALHSQNADAYVSFIEGPEAFKRAHIGICWECGDTVARALNDLAASSLHRRNLVIDKKNTDSLHNQVALFWLRQEIPILVGADELDPDVLLRGLALPLGQAQDQTPAAGPPPELGQLAAMIDLPWTAKEGSLRLAENAFYLLVLSPNVGRIAIREWVEVSLESLRRNLSAFVRGQCVVDPSGMESGAFSLPSLLKGIEADGSGQPGKVKTDGPGLIRSLLRTAYLGTPPPWELLEMAVLRFRVPDKPTKKRTEIEAQARRRHALVAAMKLVLTYNREEAKTLEKLDPTRDEPAYLCGRLLAILEEIQQRASGWKLNTTLVDRFYGAASTAPASTFGTLISQAQTGHLPKLRKAGGGYDEMNRMLEDVLKRLDTRGFPTTLLLRGQAEFALGFYHQRADFRAKAEERRKNAQSNKDQTGGAQ